MREKLELAGIVAFLGTILAGFATFLSWSGIPGDITANYGAAVKDLFWVVTMAALIVASLRFLICYELLGAGAALGTGPRETYDALRASLSAQRCHEDTYARRLGAFLDKLDAFFGDARGQGERAFLLMKCAPLWTANSYDRCLLLALIYPIGVIVLVWAVSGEVGPAEQALGLRVTEGLQRWLTVGTIAGPPVALWRFFKARHRRKLAWFIIFIIAVLFSVALSLGVDAAGDVVVAVVIASSAATIVTGVVANAGAAVVAGAGTALVAGAVADGFFVVRALAAAGIYGGLAAGFVTVVVGVAVFVVHRYSASKKRLAIFLTGFTAVTLAACFVAGRYGPQSGWLSPSPLILFLGLLTLINAPFDWLSLGLTRLLLRYGIERGGPWPYALALIDAVLAAALIALLAVAMVGEVDLFDHLAEIGGGEKARVLPPMQFYLAALRTEPQAPEFWWVYATLFSTMLPSVINLFIAGFSFLRGLPILRDFLLGVMRENETMPAAHRFAAALILTLQGSFAVVFAVGAQALLAWGLLWHLMPMLGLGVLDLAEKVAI